MLIIIVLFIVVVPIAINEINMRPKLELAHDVSKILENIKSYEKESLYTEESLIENGYFLGNDYYEVEGNGVIFVEDSPSIFLSRKGRCAMKLPYSDKIMSQDEICPKYRLINGIKAPIIDKDDGLYKESNIYKYKGLNVDNYVTFNESLFRIIELDNENYTMLVSNTPYTPYNKDRVSLYKELEIAYKDLIVKYSEYLEKYNWNIGNVTLKTDNIQSIYSSYIGIVSSDMLSNSSTGSYKIENKNIVYTKKSFLFKEMLLSESGAYLNKNDIVYTTSEIASLNVYPVLILNDKAIIVGGTGVKTDPYILNIEE